MATDARTLSDHGTVKGLSGLLPAADVGRLFGRTLRTLANWERSGLLVPVRLNKRRYYRISDIERLLQCESEGYQ